MRIVKLLAALVLLAGAGLVAFAYLGDLSPQRNETRIPVVLDGASDGGDTAGADGS
ncbi:hypothetical protein ACVDG3_13820 [Meridianimarinicoccus sp. RP-17]|uniref:hypothetical protein n=1 Tax=Meridianimarinicoccus zhengii TaxID=2056810 RepID=UPI001C9A9954|nr:hypothetical protein [Phycocomes zhengii]